MITFSKIPNELKQLNNWVCATDKNKIPMSAYAKTPASASDPNTWACFEQAKCAVENGYYNYLGFCFNKADNIVGIDIDKGFRENGMLSGACLDILTCCQSYTERSKSHRGFHVYLKGTLPFDGANNGNGLEIYNSKRYFVVTGEQCYYSNLIENQQAIDYVVETHFKSPTINHNEVLRSSNKLYSCEFKKPLKGKITISMGYSQIPEGGRNLSLLSIGGRLRTQGYTAEQIEVELLRINKECCAPPLNEQEVKTIGKRVMSYV